MRKEQDIIIKALCSIKDAAEEHGVTVTIEDIISFLDENTVEGDMDVTSWLEDNIYNY